MTIPYEVIVVDDASTDATSRNRRQIPGIIYLRAEPTQDLSPLQSWRQAARGKYLLFLNNDTTVTSGWLTALHETFSLEPEAGLVGSKLVYPDGRLAGSRRHYLAGWLRVEPGEVSGPGETRV